MPCLPENVRNQAIGMHLLGLSNSEISRRVGCHNLTISCVVIRYRRLETLKTNLGAANLESQPADRMSTSESLTIEISFFLLPKLSSFVSPTLPLWPFKEKSLYSDFSSMNFFSGAKSLYSDFSSMHFFSGTVYTLIQ